MKKRQYINPTCCKLLILSIVFLCSCGDLDDCYDITELYAQRIENSSKIVYKYIAWSKYNDSCLGGYAVFDSTQSFSLAKARKLPSGFFEKLPTDSIFNLIVINHTYTDSPVSLRFKCEQELGFNYLKIKVAEYESTGKSGGLTSLEYKFKNVKETKDSLTFYGLSKVHLNLLSSDTSLGFKKGNIVLRESPTNPGIVEKLEVSAIIINSGDQSNLTDHVIFNSDSLITSGWVYIELIPENEIKVDYFSNFGLYKSVKKINNRYFQ